MPETVDVLYLPYLPLRERALIGDWELIPRAALVADDRLDPRTAELAQGLADVYVLPKPPGSGAGAFARPRQGRIGEAARDLPSLAALRWASVVAMLEANPSPLMPEDERNVNAGHWMLTSDNAMLVAHSIDREGGYTGTIVGSRVRRASLGVSVLHDPDNGLPRGEIPPPSGLRIPSFGPQPFDVAYADATWESLLRGDDAARRLGRAIEWLALVWLNDTGLSDDVRIPALRAGFEVLLDADNTKTLGDGLSRLLADKSAPVERSWRERPRR